jgi:dTDP-4-dehydrorhamnose reductase
MTRPVVILGASGMLGHALVDAFPKAIAPKRDLDITDAASVHAFILGAAPGLVINAAAYTDVDGCEDHPYLAMAVNGEAPGFLARACREAGAVLVHYSTDYVFDGSRAGYREEDTPAPINRYGISKLRGEDRVREEMDDYRIIRTSWLFGKHGKNFVDTVTRLSRQQRHVPVVSDQYGKPTYTVDLAGRTKDVAKAPPGIYHLTNEGACSWFEFAQAVIPNAVPCTSDEFPRKARRPRYSILENTKLPPMRHWRLALAEYLGERETV